MLKSLGLLLGSGESPSQVSRLLSRCFEQAAEACTKEKSCVSILFIDECDALLSSDVVAGVLSMLLDQTVQRRDGWQRILVVAATNTIDSIPSYLRRPGRFDNEIHVAPPTSHDRFSILVSLIEDATSISAPELHSLLEIAEECVGYVAADLVALVRRTAALALDAGGESIGPDLFRKAMLDVGASALRESSMLIPPETRWNDIAGDPGGSLVRFDVMLSCGSGKPSLTIAMMWQQKTLRQAIEWPLQKRDKFKSLGLQPPKGILLYGPPGCAKTTIARAAAGAVGSAFIAFSPSDVYASSYVGEAERTVRHAFQLARSTNPCILFFDEIDAIVGSETNETNHGMNRSGSASSAESRVLSTFLNEMDGVDGSWKDGVIVLAATNRPDALDKALLRPGRFDKAIYVPPPDYQARLSIFKMFCNTSSLQDNELEYLSSNEVSGLMTGAEIVGACRAGGMKALKNAINRRERSGEEAIEITLEVLEESLSATAPLLSQPGYLKEFLDFERSRLRF